MNMKKVIISLLLGVFTFVLFGCTSPPKGVLPTPGEQFQRAKKEYEKKRWLVAIDEFQKVIYNFPGATVVDTAQYYLALAYYGNKEYELAAVEFSRLMLNYPRSDFSDDAQFMSGVCYYKNSPGHFSLDQEDLTKAIAALEDFLIDHPDSPLAADARANISQARHKLAEKSFQNGLTYFKIYDYPASRVYFQLVIDDYTDTELAPKALYRLSESYFKENKFDQAKEKFDSFLSLYPDHELAVKADEYLVKIAEKNSDEHAAGESD